MVAEGTGAEARQVPNPEYATWYAQDQTVMGGLLSSMTADVLPQVMRTTTAAELWTTLHNMFTAQNRGNSINIRFQLSNTKRNGSSAVEYYHKMIMLADTMANIGQPMADEEVIGYILAGLGEEFKDLTTTITILNNNRQVTLTEFYSYLLGHETRNELTSPAEFSSSANNVGRKTDNRNNQQRHHNSNANGRNGGYRGGRGRGRGRHRGNGPK